MCKSPHGDVRLASNHQQVRASRHDMYGPRESLKEHQQLLNDEDHVVGLHMHASSLTAFTRDPIQLLSRTISQIMSDVPDQLHNALSSIVSLIVAS